MGSSNNYTLEDGPEDWGDPHAIPAPDFVRGASGKDGALGPIKGGLIVNVEIALGHMGYQVRKNLMTNEVEVLRDGQQELADDTLVPSLMAGIWQRFSFQPARQLVKDALRKMARDNLYWPLHDMFNALPAWDGQQRPLLAYMCAVGDEAAQRLYGIWLEYWLSAAIARAMRPGCNWENMLILHGPQGCGKSTFLRALAGDAWFSDNVPFHADDKVWMEAIQPFWIMECAELRGLKSDARSEQIKQRLSARSDHVRLAWESEARTRPRHQVFAGTTNEKSVLSDPTGLRRFWMLPVQVINSPAVARDRDQILAEHLQKGRWQNDADLVLPAEYWPLGALIADEYRDNPFEDYAIEIFGDEQHSRGWMTIPDCNRRFQHVLGRNMTSRDQGYVRQAMEAAGWRQTQRVVASGKRPRVYVKGIDRGVNLTPELQIAA